jgi:hypothetical protein
MPGAPQPPAKDLRALLEGALADKNRLSARVQQLEAQLATRATPAVAELVRMLVPVGGELIVISVESFPAQPTPKGTTR